MVFLVRNIAICGGNNFLSQECLLEGERVLNTVQFVKEMKLRIEAKFILRSMLKPTISQLHCFVNFWLIILLSHCAKMLRLS